MYLCQNDGILSGFLDPVLTAPFYKFYLPTAVFAEKKDSFKFRKLKIVLGNIWNDQMKKDDQINWMFFFIAKDKLI